MHGRVKVRTTEEERERKKKEQALKMKAYRAAMTKIQKKRAGGELDDEMLGLTTQILLRNPDVSTLWNIRRECVLEKKRKITEEAEKQLENSVKVEDEPKKDEAKEEPKEVVESPEKLSVEDQLQSILNHELQLTEQCLMVNPKSYNAWHHRCWSLEQNPLADWQRELQLCNKYLKYDERNFHTWDYRRYVTEKAQVPNKQELDFCTEKIKVNFSNYSSWHHRSLLLPQLYPNEQQDRPMSEEKLREELEMVLTAAFTDPNDSSAWFYQRWLLGQGFHGDKDAFSVVAFRLDPHGKAVIGLEKPIAAFNAKVQLVGKDSSVDISSWLPANRDKSIWKSSDAVAIEAQESYELKLPNEQLKLSALPLQKGYFYFKPPNSLSSTCSQDLKAELETQLQSCLDLLDYEPDSKWTLLTSSLLMRAIDPSSHHEKSLEHLEKLQKVDPLRKGYYQDLAARWTLEYELNKWPQSEKFPLQFELDKHAEALTSLPYGQYLIIADELGLPEKLRNLVQTFNELKL
ncbi:geranylgeranyl transferase type-2 subunit alpha [Drosophila tropicalis]|uniref:geranylgeranyl transferase type-2 subunit alpha n=1 Tax=Drosophila tropicalis TaxID=46794 RepID=UPI0035ABC921